MGPAAAFIEMEHCVRTGSGASKSKETLSGSQGQCVQRKTSQVNTRDENANTSASLKPKA